MRRELWNKLSAEDKLDFIEAVLKNEVDRLEKKAMQDVSDSFRTWCITNICAYQRVCWMIEGKAFDDEREV